MWCRQILCKGVLSPLLHFWWLRTYICPSAVQVDTGVEQGLGQLYISRNRSSIVIHGMGHFHHHFRRKISLQLSTESIDLSRYLKCNGKFMTDLKIHKEFSLRNVDCREIC